MNIFKINLKLVFIIYIILDVLSVGIGMGVPFFCILLGFPVGWYVVKRLTISEESLNNLLNPILKYAVYTSFFTFILMLVIWLPFTTLFFDPYTDFTNTGIPLILYDPKISFIGWMILMILISPLLQLITTVFSSFLTLWGLLEKKT